MRGKLWLVLIYLPIVHLKERSLEYRIYEEESALSLVGTIIRDAGLDLRYTNETLASMYFSFVHAQNAAHTDLFTIDGNVVKTAKTIDRDVICPSMLVCKISLPIQVHPVQYFEIIQVTIALLDRNDNAPVFTDDFVKLSLTEGSVPGFSLTMPTADDLDSPPFGVQTYHLGASLDMFELRATTNTDGTMDVELVLTARLDRETQEMLSVVLVAVDGGVPPHSGSTIIEISVLDINDHHPEFEHKAYNVSVMENLDPGTKITQVTALDLDAGEYGDILYGFNEKTTYAYGDMFWINTTDGSVYVSGNLDRELRDTYVLTVIASDSNPDSSAKARVTINVQDQNDNAPRITQHSRFEDRSAHISEYSTNGTFVAHLTVADPDSNRNGEFTCVLDDSNFALHEMYVTEFKIVTVTLFDREAESTYELMISCHDHGISPKTSSLAISVHILDENDNSPVFSELHYETSVLENNESGAMVIQLNANDADYAENGRVRYHIDRYINDLFSIDEETGVIVVNAPLDREQIPNVRFLVFAVDNGDPPRTATTTVIVNILDENDENPEFLQPWYNFVVNENEAVGTEFGQVEALDADLPPFNSFTFSMHPGHNADGAFAVDERSGKLMTRQILDRELTHQYTVIILATSVGFVVKSSTTSVTINVADKNDNSPFITHPSRNNDTVYILSSAPEGFTVTRVLAYDLDIGCNAKLSYNISRGNTNKHFHMDSDTGVIIILRKFPHNHQNSFSLVVSVCDCGAPVRFTEAALYVLVNESSVVLSSAAVTPLHQNLTVVVVIACVTSVFAFVLIVAISALMRKRRTSLQKLCCRQLVVRPRRAIVSVESHVKRQDRGQNDMESVGKPMDFDGVYCGDPTDTSNDCIHFPRSSASDSQVSWMSLFIYFCSVVCVQV